MLHIGLLISVVVPQGKKDAMRKLIDQIRNQDLQTMSFHEKRLALKELIIVTNSMMFEQEKAFDEAVAHVNENHSATVVLDSDVTGLIHEGIDLQAKLMASYL